MLDSSITFNVLSDYDMHESWVVLRIASKLSSLVKSDLMCIDALVKGRAEWRMPTKWN